MKFPFISRAHHEEEVTRLKDQLKALAKLLYPDGIPEEFQLMLGIRIEGKSAAIEEEKAELTEDEKVMEEMKAERAADLARLERIRRTRPSQLGDALARHMQKWGQREVITKASPAVAIFEQAKVEALRQA